MTNRFANLFGGGHRPALRSPGVGRRVWILCLALGLVASALPAWAAELVEVRVGRHPEFTRVVFELDRAAGYRIERSAPSADTVELVVSLEASSAPRNIESKKSLIKQVDVEPRGSRSIARVRLAQDGLRLKEMILTNPPRIVLDVLVEKSATPKVARAASSATKATRPAEPPSRVETAKLPEPSKPPTPVAPVTPTKRTKSTPSTTTSTQTASSTKTATAPERVLAPLKVEPKRVANPPTSESATGTIAAAQKAAEEAAKGGVDDALKLAGDEPSTSTRFEDPDALQQVARPEPAPKPVRGTASTTPSATAPNKPSATPTPQRTPRPMVAKSTTSEDEGGGFMTWALILLGAIALLAGGVFVARRGRGAGVDADDDSDSFEDQDEDAVISAADGNPFAGLGSASSAATKLGKPGDVTVPPALMDDDATIASSPLGFDVDEEKKSESVVFDDTEETVMDDMEVISRDQVNESLGGAMPPMMGGAVPEEFQRMMAEMSRRMEALESRCDELVDARDRLERQVAAQTEELRVQRAAIARTQRAVRNLGRPEGEEQEATEPALRDPNRPSAE